MNGFTVVATVDSKKEHKEMLEIMNTVICGIRIREL